VDSEFERFQFVEWNQITGVWAILCQQMCMCSKQRSVDETVTFCNGVFITAKVIDHRASAKARCSSG